jgi:hypothetical protein
MLPPPRILRWRNARAPLFSPVAFESCNPVFFLRQFPSCKNESTRTPVERLLPVLHKLVSWCALMNPGPDCGLLTRKPDDWNRPKPHPVGPALCIRSKDMKPNWLWLIIVLVGVGKFAVNWGTGQWTYQPIAIQIPCFSMTHPLFGPWTVAAYVPLGAMVFLHRRWKMKITGASIPPPVQAPERKAGV